MRDFEQLLSLMIEITEKDASKEDRYALWGLPKGTDDGAEEQLLLSFATAADCDKVEPIAAKDGWHRFRRTLIDDAPPDFTKVLNTKRRR